MGFLFTSDSELASTLEQTGKAKYPSSFCFSCVGKTNTIRGSENFHITQYKRNKKEAGTSADKWPGLPLLVTRYDEGVARGWSSQDALSWATSFLIYEKLDDGWIGHVADASTSGKSIDDYESYYIKKEAQKAEVQQFDASNDGSSTVFVTTSNRATVKPVDPDREVDPSLEDKATQSIKSGSSSLREYAGDVQDAAKSAKESTTSEITAAKDTAARNWNDIDEYLGVSDKASVAKEAAGDAVDVGKTVVDEVSGAVKQLKSFIEQFKPNCETCPAAFGCNSLKGLKTYCDKLTRNGYSSGFSDIDLSNPYAAFGLLSLYQDCIKDATSGINIPNTVTKALSNSFDKLNVDGILSFCEAAEGNSGYDYESTTSVWSRLCLKTFAPTISIDDNGSNVEVATLEALTELDHSYIVYVIDARTTDQADSTNANYCDAYSAYYYYSTSTSTWTMIPNTFTDSDKIIGYYNLELGKFVNETYQRFIFADTATVTQLISDATLADPTFAAPTIPNGTTWMLLNKDTFSILFYTTSDVAYPYRTVDWYRVLEDTTVIPTTISYTKDNLHQFSTVLDISGYGDSLFEQVVNFCVYATTIDDPKTTDAALRVVNALKLAWKSDKSYITPITGVTAVTPKTSVQSTGNKYKFERYYRIYVPRFKNFVDTKLTREILSNEVCNRINKISDTDYKSLLLNSEVTVPTKVIKLTKVVDQYFT